MRQYLSMRIVASCVTLTALLLLGGCLSVHPAKSGRPLTEDQMVDMMEHADRWIDRTVSIWIYPYDNGYSSSYVACLEACDAAGADRSLFLISTRPKRFEGYRGDRAELVKVVVGRICPDNMPLCLDEPLRVFRLTEVG